MSNHPIYVFSFSLLLNLFSPLQAEELFLEGVSILGSKKTASVVYNEQTISLHKGDSIGDWRVEYIEERSIKLKDKAGKLHTVELHSSLSNDKASENTEVTELSDVKKNKGFQPRVIKDEDVLEGHRRIRTPFGDVLVKETPAVPVIKDE